MEFGGDVDPETHWFPIDPRPRPAFCSGRDHHAVGLSPWIIDPRPGPLDTLILREQQDKCGRVIERLRAQKLIPVIDEWSDKPLTLCGAVVYQDHRRDRPLKTPKKAKGKGKGKARARACK